MSRVHWRSLFPEWRRLLVAVVVCAALMSLGQFLPPVPDDERPYMEAMTWLLPGVLWALLVGARPSHLVWQMLELRVPGIARVLLFSWGANALLLLCMAGLLVSADDLGRIGGTLLLGWALGLLALALPGHWSAPFWAAAIWLVARYGQVWWPQTAFEFWFSTLVVLSLVAVLWWRQCSSGRPWLPMGFLLDVPMLVQLEQVHRNAPARQGRVDKPGANPMQRLRTVLAPELKGVFQASRWRVRWLSVFCFSVLAAFLVWLEPGELMKIVVAQCLLVEGIRLLATPTRYFLAQRASASQVLIAELNLLPGLPGERQWLWALCVQVVRGMLERLLAVGLLACLIAWSYELPQAWLQWLWIYLVLVMVLGVGQVLRVGLLGGHRWCWRVLELGLLGVGGASCSWLILGMMPAGALLAFWLAMVGLAGAYCLWLYQCLQQRGAPYFS